MTTEEDDDWDEDADFECPECGGGYYGVNNALLPPDRWTYSCHGNGDGYCPRDFKWPIADSWKYFLIVRSRPFKSKEEYDEYHTVEKEDDAAPHDS